MKALFGLGLLLSAGSALAQDYNQLVLDSIKEMPSGGAYALNKAAATALTSSISNEKGQLKVKVDASAPAYCSGATYQVFLKTLGKLQAKGDIKLSTTTLTNLGTRPKGGWLVDGMGVWGRWNANGPGTAGLFSALKLGPNFTDDTFTAPKPGDFMKIFWKSDVGKKESGHSVVFMGVVPKNATGKAVKEVCYWSANQGTGFGTKCVERSKVKNAIFSRLTSPENIERVGEGKLKDKDAYLASLLKVESSFAEAVAKTGAEDAARAARAKPKSH